LETLRFCSSISERESVVDLDGKGVDVEGIVESDDKDDLDDDEDDLDDDEDDLDDDLDEDDFLVEIVFVLSLSIESSDDSIISEFGFLVGFSFSAILLYIMNIIYILLILY
jgi:hypothetical protein